LEPAVVWETLMTTIAYPDDVQAPLKQRSQIYGYQLAAPAYLFYPAILIHIHLGLR
jgi:hypothetical protein